MELETCVKFIELSNRRWSTLRGWQYDVEIKETRYDIRESLSPFLPTKALDDVVAMLSKHNVRLLIETPRKEKLGYYDWVKVIIGINNDLDKDSFLSVFLHEYSHLLTRLSFPKAPSHYLEFYYCIQELVLKFISNSIIEKDLFLSIVNRDGDYEMYKKHFKFKFSLATIRVGSPFILENQIFIRGKGKHGMIDCLRLCDQSKSRFKNSTEVLPVLDLNWL